MEHTDHSHNKESNSDQNDHHKSAPETHGEHHNHHNHHQMMLADFKKRLWILLVLTLPVLLLSPMIQNWLGLDWNFKGAMYILFGLSGIIYFYGGFPFLKGLVEELRTKSAGMMTLIAVAIMI
ncbi:MAG: hypothetical protein KDC34_15125 [Saprospiraceae bacterium]|nr:hypothetical protein [Saprospiraceae bacterium]